MGCAAVTRRSPHCVRDERRGIVCRCEIVGALHMLANTDDDGGSRMESRGHAVNLFARVAK